MTGTNVGSVFFDIGHNQNAFEKGIKQSGAYAQKTMGSAFGTISKMAVAAFSVAAITKFGSSAIELGSNLAEVQNVVDVTFGSMSQDINTFAKNSIEQFGLSELSAKQYTGTMGAMLKSMGLTSNQSVKLSKDMAGLAGDFASFYNISTDEAFNKIRSGISGETEPLKQLGINMSVANMEAYALSKGIDKSYASMNQAEQSLLRYNYLMSVSADAQGDFARTSSSWANQTRILKLQWDSLKATLGQAFIAIGAPALQLINELVKGLQIAAEYFKAFVESITGQSKSIVVSAKETKTNLDAINDSTGDLGKQAKDTGKEIKKSLMGFDTLNILPNLTETTDSLDGISLDNITLPKVEVVTDTQSNQTQSMLDGIKTSVENFLSDLKKNPMFKALSDNFTLIKDSIKNLWDGITSWFTPETGKVLLAFLAGISDVVTPIVAGLITAVADSIKWLGEVIKGVPEDKARTAGEVVGIIVTAFLVFKTATMIAGIITGISGAFSSLIGAIMAHPLIALAAGVVALFAGLVAYQSVQFHSSELGKYVDQVERLVENSDKFNKSVDTMLEDGDGAKKDIENKYGGIKILAEKYFDLATQSGLSAENQALMKQYAGELVGAIPALAEQINATTGAYTGTKEEVMKLIEKTKEYYLVQAAQKSLIAIAEKQFAAEKNLATLQSQKLELQNKINDANARYDKLMAGKDYMGKGLDVINLADQIRGLNTSMTDLDGQINTTKTSQNNLSAAWDYATNYIKTYSTGVDKSKTATEKITDATKNANDAIADLKSRFDKSNLGEAAKKALTQVSDEFKKFKWPDLKIEAEIQASISNNKMQFKATVPTTQQFATGGIITQPTLAMVGEQGKEAVVPLEHNTEWMNTLAGVVSGGMDLSEVVKLLKTMLQAIKEGKIMQVNDKILGEVVTSYQNGKFASSGHTVLDI